MLPVAQSFRASVDPRVQGVGDVLAGVVIRLDANLVGEGAEVMDAIGKRLARCVGSNYNARVSDSRHLFLAFTDTDSFNSRGFVTANVATAPVPQAQPQPERSGHRH